MGDNTELRELRKLVEEGLNESRRTREKLESHIRLVRIFTLVKYLVITGVLAWLIISTLPFLKPLVDLLETLPMLPQEIQGR